MSPGGIIGEYTAALLQWDDARRRHHAATVGGDVSEAERAALDVETAQSELCRLKHDGATALLMLVRWTEEQFPGRLAQVLGVAERVEDIESAVLTLADEVAAIRGPARRAA